MIPGSMDQIGIFKQQNKDDDFIHLKVMIFMVHVMQHITFLPVVYKGYNLSTSVAALCALGGRVSNNLMKCSVESCCSFDLPFLVNVTLNIFSYAYMAVGMFARKIFFSRSVCSCSIFEMAVWSFAVEFQGVLCSRYKSFITNMICKVSPLHTLLFYSVHAGR